MAPSWSAQQSDPGSMLTLYRTALGLRHTLPELGAGELTWRLADPGVLVFDRGPGFTCVLNLGAAEVTLPHGTRVLLSSVPLMGAGRLPVDAAAWLTRAW